MFAVLADPCSGFDVSEIEDLEILKVLDKKFSFVRRPSEIAWKLFQQEVIGNECFTFPYLILSYLVLPCPVLPLPHLILPYPTLLSHTLPTLSCLPCYITATTTYSNIYPTTHPTFTATMTGGS